MLLRFFTGSASELGKAATKQPSSVDLLLTKADTLLRESLFSQLFQRLRYEHRTAAPHHSLLAHSIAIGRQLEPEVGKAAALPHCHCRRLSGRLCARQQP